MPASNKENVDRKVDLLKVSNAKPYCNCFTLRPGSTKGVCAHAQALAKHIGKDISFFMHEKDKTSGWIKQVEALKIANEDIADELPRNFRELLRFLEKDDNENDYLSLKDETIVLTPVVAGKTGARKGRRSRFKRFKAKEENNFKKKK